jgi:biotin transport system permease protein
VVQRIVLHYFPVPSPLHRWDARCKSLGLLAITMTLLETKTPWLIFGSGLLLGLLMISRLPLRAFLREVRLWALFLFVLFLFQAFFTPGPRLPFLPWIPVSKNGLSLGVLTCWRLGLLLGYGILFTAVTRPKELRDALIWALKPFPFLPGRRVGLMVSLTLHFFPLILDEAETASLAQKARGGDQRKNPFRRAKFLALPLLRRSISRADEVTFALAARGYREDLPIEIPKIPGPHWIPLLAFLGILLFLARLWK